MSSTAEQRRAARRRKILENSEGRMMKIFGVEGKERAPGLEDSNPYNVTHHINTDDNREEDPNYISGGNNNNEAKTEEKDRKASDLKVTRPSAITSPTYEESFFRDGRKRWYARRRIVLAAAIGGVLRLLAALNVVSYVFLIWIVYQVVIEVVYSKTAQKTRFPQHGHVVDLLLYCGYAQDLVKLGGRISEVVSRVLDDSVVMFLSFMLVHSLVGVVQ